MFLMCLWRPCPWLETEDPENKRRNRKGKTNSFITTSSYMSVVKWSSQYSSRSLPQRKRTSQSNNKEGRRGAHCKYTKVYARFMFILTWDSMIMLTSSWQMGEMEISRAVAERSLREHMGNVVEALIALTNWLLWDVWTHWTAFFLLGMTLSFSHCTYSVIKGTFFKQSLPVQLTSLHLLETLTLFLIMDSR